MSLYNILVTPRTVRVDLDDALSNKTRMAVALAMNNEMFVCPIKDFLVDYNPAGKNTVADEDILGCKEYLLETGVLQESFGEWNWRDYQDSFPKKGLSEKALLDDLKHIMKDIFRYAENIQKKRNTFFFEMVPDNELHSGISGSNHKMDACIVEAEYTSTLQNNNIVIAFEGKRKWDIPNQIDVREQIVADSHHILCDDPRRMFIYGVTLQDNRMSIWYFSRTHSVKAFAFDWIKKELDTFIHVMLSFAFGTPEDLGIDPTVHKALRDDMDPNQHYVYEFDIDAKSTHDFAYTEPGPATRSKMSKANADLAERKTLIAKGKQKVYYRTIQSINPQRPLCISGRITRIWKVEQVQTVSSKVRVAGTEPVILKDVWADVDHLNEGANQDAIFKAVDMFIAAGLEKYSGPDAMMQFIDNEERFAGFNDSMKARLKYLFTEKNYTSLFLTKLHAKTGKESKPLSAKASRCTIRLFSRGTPKVLHKGNAGETSRQTDNDTPVATFAENAEAAPTANLQPANVVNRRRYSPKIQSRFVYKEVCTEVHALPTFGDMMKVLRQTLDALQILYCAGWVHRDISIGNIMATPIKDGGQLTGWNAKLSDFEFAQPLGQPTHRANPRAGTPYYMPVEIMVRRYFAQKFLMVKQDTKLVNRARGGDAPQLETSLAVHFGLETSHALYGQLHSYKKTCLPPVQLGLPAFLPADVTADALVGTVVKPNYQHDLESIWWIVIYFITMCAGHTSDEATTFTNHNFTHSLDNRARQGTLTSSINYELDEMIHPRLSNKFTQHLEVLREYMHKHYVSRVVFGQTMIHHTYAGVHAEFAELFDLILGENLENWQQLPLYKRGAVRGVKCGSNVGDKRGHDDDEVGKPSGGVSKRLKND